MEKFEEVEQYIQEQRNNKEIDKADYLTRELMKKFIEKENYKEAKRVVEEMTDKPGSITGRKKHLENLTDLAFDKI